MDSMSLLEAKTKRTTAKASLTRHKTAIENFEVTNGSRHDITERKKRLTELWNLFDIVQSRIELLEFQDPSLTNKDELLAQQQQHRSQFENIYFSIISRCDSLIEYFDQRNPVLSSQRQNDELQARAPTNRESRIKLPKIELPVFTGDFEDWYTYQDTFEKLIHANNSLTEIEKFHYLRSSLKDKASEIIKSIETTTDNYKDAWDAVKERFDNKRWIIQRHIRAIFEAPSLLKENHSQLRELLDTISKHLRALKALKRPAETWDDLIVHIILSKLDSVTSKAWETSLPTNDPPNLKTLTEFLSKRCQALELIFSKMSINQSTNTPKFGTRPKSASVTNIATSDLSCPQCKETHPLYYCKSFLKLPIEKRISVVKRAHLCANCLRSNSHNAKDCNSSACRKCKKKHNTLLHLSNSTDHDKPSVPNSELNSEKENSIQPIVTQCLSTQRSLNIILSTAIIHVFDYKNELHSCRALLDSGSQLNFITQELADKLGVKRQSINISVSSVVKNMVQAKTMINVCIKSRFNNFTENLDCIVLPQITQRLPQHYISKHNLSIPNHLKMADPSFNVPEHIDMLIGAELFWRLISAGQIQVSKNQPTLQKTLLG
ncbi:PREDICTED: uncharacterized protein LOC108763673 [Trachymyrmex cornetzi]|uniref:uncharacterized protein LOC108763673 n=1 Tax=Trachymyrmex cornetzi TaxID=471704 RepID=UPI00084EEA4A|nr:PREDICTED: uncharacterized protein LOC108763673 [Trachymyrmex cornetzi]